MDSALKFLINIGPHWFNRLELPIRGLVNRIRLEHASPGYLEFSSLTIEADGVPLTLEDLTSLKHSTLHPSMGGSVDRIFEGGNFHSEFETRPFLEVSLKRPVQEGRLILRGKVGRLVGRMSNLVVHLCHDDIVLSSYAVGSAGFATERLTRCLQDLLILDGTFIDSPAFTELSAILNFLRSCNSASTVASLDYPPGHVDKLRFELLAWFRERLPREDEGRQRLAKALFQFLAYPSRREWVTLNDYRLLRFVIALCTGYGKGACSPSFRLAGEPVEYGVFLRSLCSYFYSAEELIQLQNDVIDELRRLNASAVPIITRHGWSPSRLHSDVEGYVGLLQLACARMKEQGMQPMLAYGTLLGAVRKHSFIAHDDDVDLFVVLELPTLEALREHLSGIAKRLADDTLLVEQDSKYEIVRITDRSGRGLDLFPLILLPDGTAHCHHRSMKLASVPREHLLPPSVVQLYGHEFGTPANAAQFLEWRYGGDWQVEKQFFEMEWVYA